MEFKEKYDYNRTIICINFQLLQLRKYIEFMNSLLYKRITKRTLAVRHFLRGSDQVSPSSHIIRK